MTLADQRAAACHNCRQRRLKCDQSLPQCSKCIKRGQVCLGYGRLIRWEQGIASRGKMAGRTFSHTPIQASYCAGALPLGSSLIDPLYQDLDHDSKRYLFYFASDVCKDLVLYDLPKRNPFRELLPMARQHPILLQIIIANSALHMSNSYQRSLFWEANKHSPSQSASPSSTSSSISSSISSSDQRYRSYSDALQARQEALRLLRTNLSNMETADVDVTLAVVILFTEFELIDTGRDNWKHHVEGARIMIDRLCLPTISTQTVLSPLRSCLVSNCLVFDIIGSSLASSTGSDHDHAYSTGVMTLIRDEEGNHCSSFPICLLQLLQLGARLWSEHHSASSPICVSKAHVHEARRILTEAHSFNASIWAKEIQARSPVNDLAQRTHVANAHRAAVCIYLSHVALSLDAKIILLQNLESLVTDIVINLSAISQYDALFTATTWPAFIAGAETHDHTTREWVVRRFQQLWEVEPWGLMRGALEVLERIWADSRTGSGPLGYPSDTTAFPNNNDTKGDWIGNLRSRGVDWLIL